MNIDSIRQAMLKKAASVASNPSIDQTRVYTDVKQLPGGRFAAFNYPTGAIGSELNDAAREGFKAVRDMRSIGNSRYRVEHSKKGDNHLFNWGLQGPDTDDFYDIDKRRSITIDPKQLPSYYFGLRLLNPSMQQDQRNTSDRPASLKRFNNEQIYKMFTGDSTYLDKRLAHFNRIPKEYWDRGNLRLSSQNELDAWRKYIPQITQDGERIAYNPISGNIHMHPATLNRNYDSVWKDFIDGEGFEGFTGVPRLSNPNKMNMSATWPSMVADTFLHEHGHQNIMGQLASSDNSGYPFKKYYSKLYDQTNTTTGSNIPAIMRQIKWNPFLATDKQLGWLKTHAIDPYAVSEPEMNQALMAMNEGRYALKRDMGNNLNNTNYKQLDPNIRKQFMALPDFIEPGDKGIQQFDNMMQLFIKNPELKLLMPEQFRLVGYYQNLKAAVDTAKTPEEKAYFQNLINKMIYSKAFLANNQQTRPTYQDAYQQMYA